MKKSKQPKQPSALPPPAHLETTEADIWRQVVAHHEANGSLLAVDAGVIELYATSLVRLRRLNAALREAVLMTDGRVNPLLKVVEATAATVKNAAHVLGLSPLARKTIPAKGATKKAGGVWAGILD